MMFPTDLVEQIVTQMVESSDYTWWYDEDTATWHAQQKILGIERTSQDSRDHALIWLWHALHDSITVQAYWDAITQTGA